MLTPTRSFLGGQLPGALHPFFHFVPLFHFRSRVCPAPAPPPFPWRPFPFGTCCERAFLRGHCVRWKMWTGCQCKVDGRLPSIGSAHCLTVHGCAGLAQPCAAPPSALPHAWVSVCVVYRGGVSSEWFPPPASAAAASRGLPESQAGGESGCGLVFTVIVASPGLGGLHPGLLLPRECAFTAITRSLPGLPTHPGIVRVESDLRTRVCLWTDNGAERPGGKGAPGRLDVSFRPGGPGTARRGPRRKRGQPRLQLLSLPPSQFIEGYLKTGTQALGGGRGSEARRAAGIADNPGRCVHPRS